MAQSRQKSYIDFRRRELEFEVDDWVYLKVSPMKGVMRFGKKGKLSPRYIGPYRIVRKGSPSSQVENKRGSISQSPLEEPICEEDEDMKKRYPHLFQSGEVPN
ncbi:hypothetical protein MTR67_035874 [Solanum verrucosum]|uniref:Tf2-1-like SH3-like domain-containing protein n=1 Tax=Solanum verrucosum TaxID=315347 RepID=A0AAF0UAZ3_SOLVR|nr:hypothetical protein MTR67_035874 [Solanum verrucosum]